MQFTRLSLISIGPQDVFPPVDGGKEGIFGALQALAKSCDITYAFPCSDQPISMDGYTEAGINVIPVRYTTKEKLSQIFLASIRLQPYKFEKYSNQAAVDAFSAAVCGKHYDAILCFHAHTARLGEGLRAALRLNIPILVREHNIEYELVSSYRKSLGWAGQLAALPFEFLTRREEHRIWKQADAVAFLSDHDLALARKGGHSGNFVLAREGVPMPARRLVKIPNFNAPLLVLLNPKAAQSVSNLRDFLHRYWIEVASDMRLTSTALHVTGVNTEQLAELTHFDVKRLRASRVCGLGFVHDLSATFANALALVSPTFVGGGIRKKILEAMANQLPVIATKLDISTCAYFKPGSNILDMQNAESFCAQVAKLKAEPKLWLQLSEAGRSTVETHANWEQCAMTLLDEIRNLKNTRGNHVP